MDKRILMGQDIFLQKYYKIFKYFYQIKNTLDALVTHLKFYHGNLKDFQMKVLEI